MYTRELITIDEGPKDGGIQTLFGISLTCGTKPVYITFETNGHSKLHVIAGLSKAAADPAHGVINLSITTNDGGSHPLMKVGPGSAARQLIGLTKASMVTFTCYTDQGELSLLLPPWFT